MAQLSRAVEPFGEVNVYRQSDGRLEIVATIQMVPDIEGAATGLVLDGSSSMRKMYGHSAVQSSALAKLMPTPNLVQPVARTMASYLSRFSSDQRVSLAYWALGPDGSQIEEIGRHNEAEIQTLAVVGPVKKPWGRGTRLLPPVRWLVEEAFANAPWAIAVLVTDGVIDDLPQVKQYCQEFARQIATGNRAFVKFVLLGVGSEIDEAQMEELDDMFRDSPLRDPHGQPIDLWDHKLAAEMKALEEIFAEVVSEDAVVAPRGRILDHLDRVVKDYVDGLPAYLRFVLPADCTTFTLDFPGGRV